MMIPEMAILWFAVIALGGNIQEFSDTISVH